MRKRTRFKSPVLDFFVIAVCLSVAGFFAYTFWKDLNSSARRSDKTEIAIITFKNRIAQRKFEDRVVWERIDKSTPLYNGDLVKTAELAEAVITFNDGSSVNIYENTMIQVYYSDFEGVQIDLDSGNLQLDSSDSGKVQLTLGDGSKVSAGAGTSLSTQSAAGSGASSVAVRNGSALITGKTGKSEALNSGETVSVKSTGEIAKTPVTVTSIPPELKVLNVDGGELPVKLEWNKENDSQPVVLQLSTKKDYSDIKEEKLLLSENDTLISLSEGTIYWRVFPQGKEEEASEGKISVASASPLSLISPAQSGVFHFRNRNPSLNFRWNGNDYAKSYLLKVSSTPDMNTPVVEETCINPYVQIDSLGCGQWWWQVIPYYEINSIGYAGPSNISTFRIEKADAISAPSLTVPLQHAEIYYKDSPSVNFSWKSDIKASYELIIAADKDFKDIITRRNTAGQRASVDFAVPEENGQAYYWKVVRNSSEPDDFSPESQVRSFTLSEYVEQPTKLLYPPEEYSTELSKLANTQFIWKASDEAKNKPSKLQVSSSKDFTSLQIEEMVEGNNFENMMLPQGQWYWRVATETTEGVYDYTEPRLLLVQKELEAPEITNIKEESEVLVTKNESTSFTWTPVKGADYYNVRVFDSDNKLVAEEAEAHGSSVSFKLADDNYSVKIQAVAAQTDNSPLRTGPVEAVDFSVRTPDSIKALAPASNGSIDGLTALRTPVTFSWQSGQDKPASSELVIKKRQNNGSFKTVERIKTSKYSASVERLSSGSYTWQVLASTKEGVPINSQEISFLVTAVDPLKKPVLTAPENNIIFDSKFLRKNRSISFEWKAVEDASSYNLVLYKIDNSGKRNLIWSEKNIKTNKIKLKKLNILDVGYFEWNVTAFSYAKDGFEERPASIAKGNFRISFDSPNQIKTEKKDRMFIEEE